MDKGLELLQEEQLETLKGLRDEIFQLRSEFIEKVAELSENSKTVTVDGEVVVNTEKEVTVTNLEEVKDTLVELGDLVSTAIKEHSHKPVDTVTIKNIKEAVAKEIKINNLGELAKEFAELKKVIIENKPDAPIVNVEKQDIALPTDPRKPLAVRLSDGKSFYNAITAAVSSATANPGIIDFSWDNAEQTVGTTNEVWTFTKGGQRRAVVTITYTDSTKSTIESVVRS